MDSNSTASSENLLLDPANMAAANETGAQFTKPTSSVWFTAEIQQMMHGFGDCRRPLVDSALLLENIIKCQLTEALRRAEDTARQRNARFIGIEDFLFLLRKDKVKLRRLIRYMSLKDMKSRVMSGSWTAVDSSGAAGESIDTADLTDSGRYQPRKRRKICLDFLSAIDQSQELVALCDDADSTVDDVKHERMQRVELMSRGMDAQQYLEFCNARQVSFMARYKAQKFKDWLLQGVTLEIKPNPLALETLSYLAYETLGQLMDLSLLVRRDMEAGRWGGADPMKKHLPSVMVNYSAYQYDQPQNTSQQPYHVNSSPLNSPQTAPSAGGASLSSSSTHPLTSSSGTNHSKKLKRHAQNGGKDLQTWGAITVAHIREAVRRYGDKLGPFEQFNKYPMGACSKYRLFCA